MKIVNPINNNHIVLNAFTILTKILSTNVFLFLYFINIIVEKIYMSNYNNILVLN